MDKEELVLTTTKQYRFRNWVVELWYQSRDALELTLKIAGICILSLIFTFIVVHLFF